MTLEQCLLAGVVILGCSALQSGVGFGFDLLALPLLVLLGVELPVALLVLLVTSTAQVLLTVHQLRDAVNWRELAPVILVSLLSMPLGIFLLRGEVRLKDPFGGRPFTTTGAKVVMRQEVLVGQLAAGQTLELRAVPTKGR